MLWLHRHRGETMPEKGVEARTQQIGRELLAATRNAGASKKFWKDRLIAWALSDEKFKVQLFRFIDVFPVLKTPAEVHAHLTEYLQGIELPTAMAMSLKAGGWFKGTLASTIAAQVEGMAATFIAGRDAASAIGALEERWQQAIA